MLCGSLNIEIHGRRNPALQSLADFIPREEISTDSNGVFVNNKYAMKKTACYRLLFLALPKIN